MSTLKPFQVISSHTWTGLVRAARTEVVGFNLHNALQMWYNQRLSWKTRLRTKPSQWNVPTTIYVLICSIRWLRFQQTINDSLLDMAAEHRRAAAKRCQDWKRKTTGSRIQYHLPAGIPRIESLECSMTESIVTLLIGYSAGESQSLHKRYFTSL